MPNYAWNAEADFQLTLFVRMSWIVQLTFYIERNSPRPVCEFYSAGNTIIQLESLAVDHCAKLAKHLVDTGYNLNFYKCLAVSRDGHFFATAAGGDILPGKTRGELESFKRQIKAVRILNAQTETQLLPCQAQIQWPHTGYADVWRLRFAAGYGGTTRQCESHCKKQGGKGRCFDVHLRGTRFNVSSGSGSRVRVSFT